MSESGLTAPQRRCLTKIHEHLTLTGVMPTHRWLMRELGVASANGIACHLRPLVRKGYLLRVASGATQNFRLAGLVVRLEYTDDESGRRLKAALEGGG